MYWYLMMRGLM